MIDTNFGKFTQKKWIVKWIGHFLSVDCYRKTKKGVFVDPTSVSLSSLRSAVVKTDFFFR